MDKSAKFKSSFHFRKLFLGAGLFLFCLALAFTFLNTPIPMRTEAAPAVEPKALVPPLPTPEVQPSPENKPAPRYVRVREKPAPTPSPNRPPTVTLTIGSVTKGAYDLVRESASTVCVGDQVALKATASDPDGDTLLYKWTTTGGRIVGEGTNVAYDSTGLAPGDYTVVVEVDDGMGCNAFDSKEIRVSNCRLALSCFDPKLAVLAATQSAKPGEPVTFSTAGVTGGREYGEVTYEWQASAGTIRGNGQTAQLDTAELAPGTVIEVIVKATSVSGNCAASGSQRLPLANELEDSSSDGAEATLASGPNIDGPNATLRQDGQSAFESQSVRPLNRFSAEAFATPKQTSQAPGCRRLVAASQSPARPKFVLVKPALAKPKPAPPPTPEPPSQYREKVTANYPERLEVDVPGKVTVQFGSEFIPIAPTPTPTVEVAGGKAKSTIYPTMPGRDPKMQLAAQLGAGYTAWIKTDLDEAQHVGLVIVRQAPEWQELKRGQDEMLTWEWNVKADLPVIEAVLVARIEIEWRAAGKETVRKEVVSRFELPIKVADPLLNQEQLKLAKPLSYASSVGFFGLGIWPWRGKRKREDAAEAEDDWVRCSVFAPETVRPNDRFMVQVSAHLPEQEEEAIKQAAKFDKKAKQRAVKTLTKRIARDTELMFDLQMKGLLVEDESQTLIWRGQPESVQFTVSVPPDCRPGDVAGKLTVSYDSVPVGHISFMLEVIDQPAVAVPLPTAKNLRTEEIKYQMVFISYASKDRDEVLRCVQMLDRFNIKYFQDVLSLDPGDRWEQKLYENIEKSDLFLLFWSDEAKKSKWVGKEVQYALDVKKKNNDLPEIKPVPLEGPPIITPPPELEELHFNDRLIYFRERPTNPH